jgi:hypothetical protein
MMVAGVRIVVAAACCALLVGCGQGGNQRQNDPGPPIQMNPAGPGPMQPPSAGGESTLPPSMVEKKK